MSLNLSDSSTPVEAPSHKIEWVPMLTVEIVRQIVKEELKKMKADSFDKEK